VAVERVVKASALRAIAAGETIVITRPGGTVTMAGRAVRVAVAGYRALRVGQRVRVAVLPVAESPGFQEQRLAPGELLRLGGER
jgi:hypothetical protein